MPGRRVYEIGLASDKTNKTLNADSEIIQVDGGAMYDGSPITVQINNASGLAGSIMGYLATEGEAVTSSSGFVALETLSADIIQRITTNITHLYLDITAGSCQARISY